MTYRKRIFHKGKVKMEDDAIKRVLILTADAGFGHRSAAIAIKKALELSYEEKVFVEIRNPLDDSEAPALLRESQSDYDRVVKESPELYRLGYEASDANIPTTLMESVLTILLFEVIRENLKDFKPDVIVCTYPMYLAPLDSVLTLQRKKIPVISVITDLASVHQIWFKKDVDVCIVPNDIVKNLAYSNGLKASQIEVCGIPVHPDFSLIKSSKKELRKSLTWNEKLPTILVVGSSRSEQMINKLNIINHSGFDFQLILVAGNDKKLFDQFNQIEWHHPAKIYEFVSEMPKFLKASDLNLCKAGGLIITESLASGLPMLLTDVIPGQEVGNAKYVEDHTSGFQIRSDQDLVEKFYHLMIDNQEKLKELQKNAKKVGKPDSAFEAAKIIWKLADFGQLENIKNKEKQTSIIGLLQKFNINVE